MIVYTATISDKPCLQQSNFKDLSERLLSGLIFMWSYVIIRFHVPHDAPRWFLGYIATYRFIWCHFARFMICDIMTMQPTESIGSAA